MKTSIIKKYTDARDALICHAVDQVKALADDKLLCEALAADMGHRPSHVKLAMRDLSLNPKRCFIVVDKKAASEDEEVVTTEAFSITLQIWTRRPRRSGFIIPLESLQTNSGLKQWRDSVVAKYRERQVREATRLMNNQRHYQKQLDELPADIIASARALPAT